MQDSRAKVPSYLHKYLATQHYESYTAEDHAVWRYIMRQSAHYFRKNGVSIYLEGLSKTGIPLDRIPKISEMDAALGNFGWGAVAVCGFIPPSVFIELQSLSILPIAVDMRSKHHIAYTPAPDIVHEAAGHAPIIADPGYADYLKSYAKLARHAIFSSEDLAVYEAIRKLSDTKENPDKTSADIDQAQKELDHTISKLSFTSEAAKVARMYWWTAEYGLFGDLDAPQIYGAGLLSSVGESRYCLSNKVRKLPLSINCTAVSYDITEPQPQLFVAASYDQMRQVLVELEETLSFRRGGVSSVEAAIQAQTVTTTTLDSGLQISGKLNTYSSDDRDGAAEIDFLKWEGPVQLAFDGKEIVNQGCSHHPNGFSSPIGRLKEKPDMPLKNLSDTDLKDIHIVSGKKVTLSFASGFIVSGVLKQIYRNPKGEILFMSFADCRVNRGSENYFLPDWGDFDMAVGEKVVSVSGGAADIATYRVGDVGLASSAPGRQSPFSQRELEIFALYKAVNELKTNSQPATADIETLKTKILAYAPEEWLLLIELKEALKAFGYDWIDIEAQLEKVFASTDSDTRDLISWERELSK